MSLLIRKECLGFYNTGCSTRDAVPSAATHTEGHTDSDRRFSWRCKSMLPLSKQEHQAGFIGQKRISTHRPLEVWLFFLAAFFFLETAFSQPPPGPSSGTGTLIYARHTPLGPQICIEIGSASPKRFVYSYDPK